MINYILINPFLFFSYLIALLVAITIHEFAHAYVADQLGDPTARLAGRLKLNPFVHLDTLGLFFLLFFGFGWGKPVPYDHFNLKNPRRDSALISLAGPVSNFILAFLLSLILKLSNFLPHLALSTIGNFFLIPMINLNLILGIFNLIPIHPLDGFKIVGGILPDDKAREWYTLERLGIIFLFLLIFPLGNGSLAQFIINPVFSFLKNLLLPSKMGLI